MIFTVLMAILYGLLGAFMQRHEWIVEPAYWALYGVVFSAVFACLYSINEELRR